MKDLNWDRNQWQTFFSTCRKNGRNPMDFFQPRKEDPLQARARLAAEIRKFAVDGQVCLNTDDMDCDCVRGTGWFLVPANVPAVERAIEHYYDGLEGPCYGCWLSSPADHVARYSRDLALEAFEDGHPWSIHV